MWWVWLHFKKLSLYMGAGPLRPRATADVNGGSEGFEKKTGLPRESRREARVTTFTLERAGAEKNILFKKIPKLDRSRAINVYLLGEYTSIAKMVMCYHQHPPSRKEQDWHKHCYLDSGTGSRPDIGTRVDIDNNTEGGMRIDSENG
ncbi:hypothetical protein EVAR_64931_1 [Eumeta japonica]|uniref:Uncharacterized protein n=1 Tax=Eumeta variegata TaxID=151549 RepID=A0A4C1ZDM2_EUMVA|nr:hypothetical protein EVAR_64931_1 [Eumeta japonica]